MIAMRARPSPTFLLFGLLFAGACSDAPPPPRPEPPPPGDVAAFVRGLDTLATRWLAHYGMPGAAFAFIEEGRIVHLAGIGYADLASRRPVTPQTPFRTGSISKAVTAWGVLRLAEEGRLDLDAPVERYLGRWRLPPSTFDHGGVTARRLLSHTAGISVHHFDPVAADGQSLSLEETLAGASGRGTAVRVAAEPGSEHRYSGGGFTLLELLVEEVTGRPFAAYMHEAVLAPLGMHRSGFVPGPDFAPDGAVGYDARRRPRRYRGTSRSPRALCTRPPRSWPASRSPRWAPRPTARRRCSVRRRWRRPTRPRRRRRDGTASGTSGGPASRRWGTPAPTGGGVRCS